jgi:alkaline phosphatase D
MNSPLTRREFLSQSTQVALAAFVLPSLSSLVYANEAAADLGHLTVPTGREYPGLPYGIQSGDISAGRAVIWSASDRNGARMHVEYATRSDFRNQQLLIGPRTSEHQGFATKVLLEDLPAGEQIFYRVRYQSPDSPTVFSPALTGTFRTPPVKHQDVSVILAGDTAGQNFGINPDIGGMRLYSVMAKHNPDLFIHLGDNIYADGPITEEFRLSDGRIWRNITTEAKTKVAETIEEFRASWRYNLLDTNVLRFNREIPVISCWDDHEVLNNWDPAMQLDDSRYSEKNIARLAAHGRQAYLEWTPTALDAGMRDRSYRSFNYGPGLDIFRLDLRSYRQTNEIRDGKAALILGTDQTGWFKNALRASTATWKMIACDMPIGLIIPDGADFDGVANGDGPVRGREHEFAEILQYIKRQQIKNVVFFTADVHYAAAHHYSPDRAVFQDFESFYEFVSGPISAVTGSGKVLDNTFGPKVLYQSRAPGSPGLSPLDGQQYFAKVKVAQDKRMTVELRNMADEVIFSKELLPQ